MVCEVLTLRKVQLVCGCVSVKKENRKVGRSNPLSTIKESIFPVAKMEEFPEISNITFAYFLSSATSAWEKEAEITTVAMAVPSPTPKLTRLPSALDARKGWRRNDGTLYSYFKVSNRKLTRVAKHLSKPVLVTVLEEKDLLCTEEGPL